MMIEHLILAKDSSIDRDKNTMSIFDIFEDIQVKANFDRVPFEIQVIGVLLREEEKGKFETKLQLRVWSPSGKIITEENMPVVMLPEHRRLRLRVKLVFEISESGIYRVSLQDSKDPENIKEGSINITFEAGGLMKPRQPVQV